VEKWALSPASQAQVMFMDVSHLKTNMVISTTKLQ
jgi:hypothetical protein